MDETKVTTAKVEPETKRAYEKPELVEYGSVRELTRGAGTKSLDFHAATRQII